MGGEKPGRNRLPCGRPAPSAGSGDALSSASDEKLESIRERLKTHLASRSLKFSEQRWKIAKLILSRRGHFSAQEIVREVVAAYPGLGAATVYRNLKVLCDAHILRETLVDAEGRIVYEAFAEEHHDHIVCLECGAIFEFHDPQIESRQQRVTEGLDFEEVRHRHVIYGRCTYREASRKK